MSDELKVDDRVQILVGGPHENYGRIATVGRIQEGGQVVVYFGDQDEDEWVYSPSELEKRPEKAATVDVSSLRRRLVELDDQARRSMLESGHDSARYYAGRSDALRDALAVLAASAEGADHA